MRLLCAAAAFAWLGCVAPASFASPPPKTSALLPAWFTAWRTGPFPEATETAVEPTPSEFTAWEWAGYFGHDRDDIVRYGRVLLEPSSVLAVERSCCAAFEYIVTKVYRVSDDVPIIYASVPTLGGATIGSTAEDLQRRLGASPERKRMFTYSHQDVYNCQYIYRFHISNQRVDSMSLLHQC